MMNDIEEVKQAASALRKQGNYGQAVELYRTLWEEHRDQCSEWEGWGYAFSLRKLGRSAQALEVCRQALPLNPNIDYLTSLCGWCLYDIEIKRTDAEIQQNEARFLAAAEEILQLGQPGQFTAHARTLMRVVDYYRQSPTSPAGKILEWCDRVQPDQLSNVPGHGPDGKGGTVGYASDREKWYACRSKALLELGRLDECIAFSEQALAAFPSFHHDNDIWFRWRIALSKAELGEKETAIAELLELLSRKKDWFIHHRIAQYLLDLGRTDEALKRAVEAVLGPGPADLGLKWELFLLMGKIFQSRSETDRAKEHVLLAAKVRQEQNWSMPAELAGAVQEMGVDMGDGRSAQEIYLELLKFWRSLKFSDMPQGQGRIKRLLPNGKSGFIRGSDGKDYHFRLTAFKGPQHLLTEGQPVSFYVEKNPDPSKCDSALQIRPLARTQGQQTEVDRT